MEKIKNIALVAHDNMKRDLTEWVEWNFHVLMNHNLVCTGTTGKMVETAINDKLTRDGRDAGSFIEVTKLKSGPLGGDQQIGAMISEGKIDILIFFWDPMEQQPHDVDIKALLRIAVLYNITTACNRASADFMISSHLLNENYEPVIKDYSTYIQRSVMK